ncbi:MAG: exodeoxyribonuclease VII small subunit [Gemmatimonadota bacterium]|jgi:exodeoxyribonuclease VII small subunit
MSDGGKQIGLEARLSRLETIVSALEREDLELDEALALFEEGIGHLREAQALIRTAELRIEQLLDEGMDAMGGVVDAVNGDEV